MDRSTIDSLRTILARDLRAVRRELEAYPDDASVWALPPGIANAAGTLALHLAGNLRHFVGACLGGTGYRRDRPSEFTRRDVSRAELLAGLDAALADVDRALAGLDPERAEAPFPEVIGGHTLPTSVMLLHLSAHLAYHLGQVDYHRRLVTGDGRTVGAVAVAELPA
jgi:hypothetical protein